MIDGKLWSVRFWSGDYGLSVRCGAGTLGYSVPSREVKVMAFSSSASRLRRDLSLERRRKRAAAAAAVQEQRLPQGNYPSDLMEGSVGSASPADLAEADLEAAEKLILRWDSTASPGGEERMLFDTGERSEAERYLRAVDEIRRSIKEPVGAGSPRRSSSSSSENAIQIAMARLEDEFRNLLLSRATEIEVEALVDLSSLSMNSASAEEIGDLSDVEGSVNASHEGESFSSDSVGGSSTIRRSSIRSMKSIREMDLLPADAVDDLRSIAERMIDAGYGRECVQVYAGSRKAAIDVCFRHLGVEKLSIGEVQRLEWDALEAKIRRWIRAARICVRIVFASERRLCERIFDGLGIADDAPFTETVKGAAIQLFGFAEAISIGRRSPEKLFKIIDLHDTISDLLPDVGLVFQSKSAESIYTQAAEILSRLAEAIRGILSEFENAVLRDPPKTPVPGGTIHPLTRLSGDDFAAAGAAPLELDFPESENQTPLGAHLSWIIVVLQHNLENKAALYRDNALLHLFLMNNIHYIVHKVKGSSELREMIGDDYLRKLTGKFRISATSYQRATWVKILHCLRDEGIHVSGSFSSGVSKSTLRDRFKAFNASFEEAHKTQAHWFVPDTQLREELRISISEKLLPAYRAFLGRFRQHIESGRHPELYIKYSVEDLEMALSDFFEGCNPLQHNRRRSHS
ncbi:exocyst complex component EXO70B1-like isoform X2 [Zingiber officinale]|uniref:exocyst complex component EXO70B1-like isoform X2 n=1 Tax=Zingiber officinale TaxID=94328 RepID=UPI001C4B7DF2|nr:exocyst complex component EXO70B1-like isoform X2 [Zingiber officinale]